jgi:hypothetical protein
MTTVKHAIHENDFVELLDKVDEWPAGTTGTVVAEKGDGKLVEISDHENWGATLDMISVDESRLKLIAKHSA